MAKSRARASALGDPVPLLGGAYESRSLIAGLQRSVNLYPESYTPDSQSPVPVTHFLTPGLTLMATAPVAFPFRRLGLYQATNGELFAVLGGNVYYIAADYTFTLLGAITNSATPVGMWDNGLALVICDGGLTGWAVDLATHAFGIIGAGYQGSTRVDYIDTFFVFNVPGTNQFYISLSNCTYADLIAGTAFDPLDIAAKTGSPDAIATFIALKGELWLVGTLTTEVWALSGGPEFPFERVAGSLQEHGCQAPYSIAKTDASAYFLMQDRQGRAMIVKTAGYALQKISKYAIDEELQNYPELDDAIGYTRQSEGHAFYVITFPTSNRTWVVELATGDWHEWESMDGNGVPNRHRSNCFAAAYGFNLVGDYATAQLWSLDPNVFVEGALPIRRLRSFPHMVDSGNQVIHDFFIANVGCGQIEDPNAAMPQFSLRWSDNRGASYGNAVLRGAGLTGQYEFLPKWWKLGRARDRVYELSWSFNAKTWLNGAWIKTRPLLS